MGKYKTRDNQNLKKKVISALPDPQLSIVTSTGLPDVGNLYVSSVVC